MNVSQETIDKLVAHMAQHGARGTAKTIIDQRLRRKVGLSSEDLADTATFASGLDEIEALLTQGEYGEAFEVAKDTVEAMLEDEGFGGMMETANGGSEIQSAIKELVDRDGVEQTAYALVNLALQKINNGNGLYHVKRDPLVKELLDSIVMLLKRADYDQAYLISSSHAKRIMKDVINGADAGMMEVRKLVKDAVKEVISESHPAFPEYLAPGGGGYKMDYKQQEIIFEALSLGKELAERRIPDGDRHKNDCIQTFVLALNTLAEMKEISIPSGPSVSKAPREPDYEMDAIRALEDNPNDEPTV